MRHKFYDDQSPAKNTNLEVGFRKFEGIVLTRFTFLRQSAASSKIDF